MNYLKHLSVTALSAILLWGGSFFCTAQSAFEWNTNKEEVFKQAKEQDKFILLLVGRTTCPACQDMSEMLCNPANPFKQILDEKYVTMYSWFDDEDSRNEVYEYIEQYYEERISGLARQLPWLYIINPDKAGEIVASSYRPYPEYRPDEITMRNFLTIDILESNNLDWYTDEDKVFELAGEQNKNILRFQGDGTSPNSQKVMSLLMDNPLKQILEDNYILWYVDDDDCGCDVTTGTRYATRTGEDAGKPLPYISIINPKTPDAILEELWGIQEGEKLDEILKKYAMSNEKILPNQTIFVADNRLYISNKTNNEQLKIYSLTGQMIANVRKNDYTFQMNISGLPKGVLIVHSSTGWSAKIVIP